MVPPESQARAALITLLLVLATGCGDEEPEEPAPMPAEEPVELATVPQCGTPAEFVGEGLSVWATLEDPTACEDGDVSIRATWEDGRTQTIEVAGFGFPTDFWPVDLEEDGVLELVVGHQDLTGAPPRVRAYRDQSGGLEEIPLPPIPAEALDGYSGGGNFHTRGGDLFFNWRGPRPADGSRAEQLTMRWNRERDAWTRIDLSRFETDRARR